MTATTATAPSAATFDFIKQKARFARTVDLESIDG